MLDGDGARPLPGDGARETTPAPGAVVDGAAAKPRAVVLGDAAARAATTGSTGTDHTSIGTSFAPKGAGATPGAVDVAALAIASGGRTSVAPSLFARLPARGVVDGSVPGANAGVVAGSVPGANAGVVAGSVRGANAGVVTGSVPGANAGGGASGAGAVRSAEGGGASGMGSVRGAIAGGGSR